MIQRSQNTVCSVLALILFTAWAGCAGQRLPADPSAERTERLERDLAALAVDAPPRETRLLAETVLRRSRALAAAYRMSRPPAFHNILVNVGLKDRGLCWHWTEDLLTDLRALLLPSYALHWGVAYPGKMFREHNSVIVTARGAPLASGLVLDPWRESGSLFWVAVGEDRYPWQAH
jgi:hypothetical protein